MRSPACFPPEKNVSPLFQPSGMRRVLSLSKTTFGKSRVRYRATAFIDASGSGLSKSKKDCIKSRIIARRKRKAPLRPKHPLLANGVEKLWGHGVSVGMAVSFYWWSAREWMEADRFLANL